LKRIIEKSPFLVLFSKNSETQMDFKVLNLDGQKKILDVGCGGGGAIANFARLGHECVGVEIHKNAAEFGSRTFGKLCSFVIADACHLPFRDRCFDIVYSTEFFSHVTDVFQALSEQTRSLRKAGQLLVRDGNFLCPPILFDLLLLYPIRTKGKYGGLKWMLNHDKILSDAYGFGFKMKDENVKTLNWWRVTINGHPNLELKLATTSVVLHHPNWIAKLFEQVLGEIVVLAERT
jgi:SAM-dependent methyltransferase